MKTLQTVSVVALAALSGTVSGQTFSGDTTGQPVWQRPLAGNPPALLSGVGTATPFEAVEFTVSINASYVFQNTAAGAWDNFTFVYQNAFNAATPLTNVVIGNDDNPSIGLSGFTVNLSAGTTYYFVTTGFGNNDFGAYEIVASAPGTNGVVNFIPAPSAAALLGLGGLVVARRRRA